MSTWGAELAEEKEQTRTYRYRKVTKHLSKKKKKNCCEANQIPNEVSVRLQHFRYIPSFLLKIFGMASNITGYAEYQKTYITRF